MEGVSRTIGSTGKPLLKDVSEMQKPPETGHHCSTPVWVYEVSS